MKTFMQIREKNNLPVKDKVFSKRVNRHNVSVHNVNNKFVVYIDNEKLDTYRTQKEAEKMGVAFAKEM